MYYTHMSTTFYDITYNIIKYTLLQILILITGSDPFKLMNIPNSIVKMYIYFIYISSVLQSNFFFVFK